VGELLRGDPLEGCGLPAALRYCRVQLGRRAALAAAAAVAAAAGEDGEPALGRAAALMRALRRDNITDDAADDDDNDGDNDALGGAECGLEVLRMVPAPWAACLSHLAPAPRHVVEELLAGMQLTSVGRRRFML
jgi:hypothetical protein